jgi:peptide/nickel transport system permease protein
MKLTKSLLHLRHSGRIIYWAYKAKYKNEIIHRLVRRREMGSFTNYIIRRLLFMIPVLLGITMIIYFVGSLAGNPKDIIRLSFRVITPQQMAYLEHYFHLDQPIYIRYFYYLWDLIHGNLGISLTSGRPVIDEIGPWVWTSMYLQLSALALSVLIGIPVGIYSAKRQYSKSDYAVTGIAIFGYSMPTFWLATMMIILFSFRLGWLPAFGASGGYLGYWWGNWFMDRIAHLIIPMSVLAYVEVATFVRLIRGSMLEILRQDYILAGYASGLKERTIIWKHALKNAITPVLTIIGLSIATALASAPALETATTWPGLGYYFVQAAQSLDLITVEGITVIITVLVLITSMILDFLYGYLDPRVRIT